MDDCEIYGSKHKLFIHHAVDNFLFGYVEFHCKRCSSIVRVDRVMFYAALRTPVSRGS
ncbi:hypothetical protein SEA_DAMASCUS_60 [Microbacterium phage Damascus]|nr:hypothetical protein SEA_DAMASCUS_60 [Microbacterium phage Damascus]